MPRRRVIVPEKRASPRASYQPSDTTPPWTFSSFRMTHLLTPATVEDPYSRPKARSWDCIPSHFSMKADLSLNPPKEGVALASWSGKGVLLRFWDNGFATKNRPQKRSTQ